MTSPDIQKTLLKHGGDMNRAVRDISKRTGLDTIKVRQQVYDAIGCSPRSEGRKFRGQDRSDRGRFR